MAEENKVTFICPACGETELPLPEGRDPQETPYVELAELHNCEQAQNAAFLFGNGYTTGFGGVVRDQDGEGIPRERWVPPRAVVAYHFSRQGRKLASTEPAPACFSQPLYRNLVHGQGVDDVFVAMTFLPHGETLSPEMRARGERLAKAMK